MKNIFYILMVTLLISGCSYNNEAVGLHAYKADYAGDLSNDHKSVYIQVVRDTRLDKRTIGYFLKDGRRVDAFYSNADFARKYKEGLGYALNIAGFNNVTSPDGAALSIEVYIKNIRIIYNDKVADQNLYGEIETEVIVHRGSEVITQHFTQKDGKWIPPSYTSKDIEPFLYSLFASSVNQIVSRLTSY